MTTPDKPEETPEGSERTSVIATSSLPGAKQQATPPAAPQEQTPAAPPAAPAEETPAPAGAPPPWQRHTEDTSGDATQNLPRGAAAQHQPSWPTDTAEDNEPATVTVPRPVIPAPVIPGTGAPAGYSPNPDPNPSGGFPAAALGGLGGGDGKTPPSALRRPGRGPRRANLQVKRFDPWSVLKLSLVLGVALFFVWLVAVGALYAVLDGMGVWDKLNGISSELLNSAAAGNSEPLISAGRVFGIAAIIGAINIVLFSALATVAAFVYNVSADLAGGLEVTLAERE